MNILNKNFLIRVYTSIFMICFTLLFLYLGSPYVNVFFSLVEVFLIFEWLNLITDKKIYYILYLIIGFFLAMLKFNFLSISFIVTCAFLVWIFSKKEAHRFLLTFGIFYIFGCLYSFITLYEKLSFNAIVWFLSLVWCIDISCYLFGSYFKGPKLLPKVSPNKTWSGLFGGIFIVSIFNSIVIKESIFYIIVFSCLVVCLEQCGDLLESFIKRKIGVKDSSKLIPGHGGILDRLDGLLFLSPIFLMLYIYDNLIFNIFK